MDTGGVVFDWSVSAPCPAHGRFSFVMKFNEQEGGLTLDCQL